MKKTVEHKFQQRLASNSRKLQSWLGYCLFQPVLVRSFNAWIRPRETNSSRFSKSLRYLLSLLLVLPQPTDIRQTMQLAAYYPHINFDNLRWFDAITFCIQSVWLLIRKPRRQSQPAGRRIRSLIASIAKKPRYLIDSSSNKTMFHARTIINYIELLARHPVWRFRILRYTLLAVAVILGGLCITTPFSLFAQLFFLLSLWGIALWLRSLPGSVPTLIMITLSLIVSTRYIWWRSTETLNWDDLNDFFFALGLLLAELYVWLILALGYFQSAWPLKRTPKSLPEDSTSWPCIDIFVPTYNEPLSVVKPTIYAAMGMDWPEDKINIYILDDGKRDEFREFAQIVGVHYMIRPDNSYAKAGNLNHALAKTEAEFVAIFDCDHIPTRSFLQTTMGWFLYDKKLALMQTPHHFFSPDPFERNLNSFRKIPNEGELFYGLIQPGNDLWNATFFCGSCAVLRRGPLMEVGGIATETVTEDAHTALKMHRLGYNSAYINLPQAAGLATESLSAHIGQRIRWARGMAQIFRLDNPIFGKGLTIAQRICYSNAMLHFFYGFPRLVFMTAPLAFLLFDAYVIHAEAIMIALYVLPHLIHSALTNSRIQGAYRHSMWSEMYETVLAWYIVRPTTVALFNPSKGKFNVTGKGGLIDDGYYDWMISRPYILLILFCIAGFGAGIFRLWFGPEYEITTVIMNLVWVSYNLLILGGAVAVASETRQVRKAHRVRFEIPAYLKLSDGRLLACKVNDYSESGVGIQCSDVDQVKLHDNVDIVMQRGLRDFTFPANIVRIESDHLGLRFKPMSNQQESEFIQCSFARADAWSYWRDGRKLDRPISSLHEVVRIGAEGYLTLIQHSVPQFMPFVKWTQHFLRGLSRFLPQTPVLSAEQQHGQR